MSKRRKCGSKVVSPDAKIKPPTPPSTTITQQTDEIYEADPDGRPVTHHRVVDSLRLMLRAGTIDQGMHDAARDFHAAFSMAALENLRASPLVRLASSSRQGGDLSVKQVQARRDVHRVIEAVGGMNSPGGSALWFVVGLGHSVSEWALRQGWCGKNTNRHQAVGILVATLGMLAHHLEYNTGAVEIRKVS